MERRLQGDAPALAPGLPGCPTCARWPTVLEWARAAWQPLQPDREAVAACQGCGQSVAEIAADAPDDMSIW
jgi:hypothetical protein